jgi:hypothetical protein
MGPCDDFRFAEAGFESIERDYLPSLLYLWSGSHKEAHGVGFLIDATSSFYLTARHVVAASINDPKELIKGIGADQKQIALEVVADNEALDVALLRAKTTPTMTSNNVIPYELYLENPPLGDATFSGMAFSTADSVSSTQPKENRLTMTSDGRQMLLRVNTDFGDSGAPVYNIQGLVVGIVTGKQRISQAVIIPLQTISDFLTPFSTMQPLGSAAWRLHDDIVNSPQLGALRIGLKPAHVPGRVSNFELLGAIEMILRNRELAKIDPVIVDCPLVEAAHDRGLKQAAFDLVKSDAPYVVEKKEQSEPPPSSPSTGGTDAKHAEAIGDVMFEHAADWQSRDLAFSQKLAREAQSNYVEAITDALQTDESPLYVFASSRDSNVTFQHKAGMVLTNMDIDKNAIDITAFTTQEKKSAVNDHFAELLNKYYHAAVAAGAPAKTMTVLRTSAAWASLLAKSNAEKAESYKTLADALMRADKPDKAARSLAEVYKLRPTDLFVLETYMTAKEQETSRSWTDFDVKTAIAKEQPLSLQELWLLSTQRGK